MLTIDLTDTQIAQLKGAFAELERMACEGNPGMLIAQVYRGYMVVGLIGNEKARALQEAYSGKNAVGKLTRIPEDRDSI